MTEIAKEDTIKGAKLQLKEFKERLLQFYQALEKMHNEKLSIQHFEQHREDVNSPKMYNNIRNLLDYSIHELKDTFTYVLAENQTEVQENSNTLQ